MLDGADGTKVVLVEDTGVLAAGTGVLATGTGVLLVVVASLLVEDPRVLVENTGVVAILAAYAALTVPPPYSDGVPYLK